MKNVARVSEKLARYGSSALSGVEHLNLACWQRVRRSRSLLSRSSSGAESPKT
jgi:hypothetical protein